MSGGTRPATGGDQPGRAHGRRRKRLPSRSLTRRILVINLVVLFVPIGGFLFMNDVEDSLIQQEMAALRVQAEIFSGAIGASAVITTLGQTQWIEERRAKNVLRRLAEPMRARARARLFGKNGELLADTRRLFAPRGLVEVEELPPPEGAAGVVERAVATIDAVARRIGGRRSLPPYPDQPSPSARDFYEVGRALSGAGMNALRSDENGRLRLSVAVPILGYRQVVGAMQLTSDGAGIQRGMVGVRMNVLRITAVAFAVTVLLSLYLAGTIARPLRRLAVAAERVRDGQGRNVEIPDFSGRRDEIGDLSHDIRAMTVALWARMDSMERFAADVAHEIKNPLSSLRSAVETVGRIDDPGQQRRLLEIVLDDVERLNRLITDISEASRVDAELSRAEPQPIELSRLLQTLIELERTGRSAGAAAPVILLELPSDRLPVYGVEGRLAQVFRNVLSNAVSFTPPGGHILIRASRRNERVQVAIEDDGPGIPENRLNAIFERFYSDRPAVDGEKFQTHSGLGLSISRQIVETLGGEIHARNRYDSEGGVKGARFVITLPVRGAPPVREAAYSTSTRRPGRSTK